MFELMPLPPGYTVYRNDCVGYEFRDEAGRVVTYHPKDGNDIRALVWDIYRRAEKPGRCANSEWYTLTICIFLILALAVCIGLRFGW